MNCLDSKSEEFLARVSAQIGYIDRNYEDSPTEEYFAKRGISLYHCGRVEVDDCKFATVFNFPVDGGDFSERYEMVDSESEQFLHTTDWPIQNAGGYSHLTYFFKSLPGKREIKTARIINSTELEIVEGELNQGFTCRVCGDRVHWTETDVSAEEPSAVLRDRIHLARNCICSTEELAQSHASSNETQGGAVGHSDPEEKATTVTDLN